MRLTYDLRGKLWRYPGPGGWHFVTLPREASEEIREVFGGGPGFGSVRVRVTVGSTTWATSIFPDKKRGAYVLPVKAAARKAERLEDEGPVRYRLVVEPI